jgi:hypothetical protein
MSLADSSYPLNIFWTMFEPILWLVWIWILTMVFIGISRSHDRSGSSPLRGSSARRTRSWRTDSVRTMTASAAGWRAGPAMALPAIGEDVPYRGGAGRFTYLAVRRTSSRGGT